MPRANPDVSINSYFLALFRRRSPRLIFFFDPTLFPTGRAVPVDYIPKQAGNPARFLRTIRENPLIELRGDGL
ncbi:hypothetical protein BEQ56_00395 [Anaerolineaceae bacterium oral taxon 439]|nr:hypothetical protein BEQ56_00395 [Anaerolineaceae bacterium oral taxon 439]